ncbi:integrase core domain-containing protein, partial [Desulfovibrio desulfuricans]
ERFPYGWAAHPDFDNCRSMGSFKPRARSGYELPGVRVVRILERLRLQGRLPQRIKVDNGPEVSGNALDTWAFEHGVQIEFTRPGKPTDNGHIESFNRKFRDECLNQNVFLSLHNARRTVEACGRIQTSGDRTVP